MAKETKNITISREEYDFLKKTSGIYKSILGVLATSIKSEEETQYKYSHNKVGNGYYCEEMDEVVRQIFTFIRFFDISAYAIITGRAIEITPDMLHDLAEMFSDDEEEDEEGEEVEEDA